MVSSNPTGSLFGLLSTTGCLALFASACASCLPGPARTLDSGAGVIVVVLREDAGATDGGIRRDGGLAATVELITYLNGRFTSLRRIAAGEQSLGTTVLGNDDDAGIPGVTRYFVRQPDAGVSLLSNAIDTAQDLNSFGIVVGTTAIAGRIEAIRSDGNLLTRLQPGREGNAISVSDDGVAVGVTYTSGPPAVWLSFPDGGMNWLKVDAGQFLTPRGMNSKHIVVGRIALVGSVRAFCTTEAGEIVVLPDFGIGAEANAISDEGEIVGSATEDDNTRSPVAWIDGGIFRLQRPGSTYSATVHAGTSRGIAVGSATFDGELPHAVYWINGVVHDLNGFQAGDRLVEALDVSSSGIAVGSAILADGGYSGFIAHIKKD